MIFKKVENLYQNSHWTNQEKHQNGIMALSHGGGQGRGKGAVSPYKTHCPPPPRKIKTPLLQSIPYVFLIKLFRYFQYLLILLKSYLISNRITEIETLWWEIIWPAASPLGKFPNYANADNIREFDENRHEEIFIVNFMSYVITITPRLNYLKELRRMKLLQSLFEYFLIGIYQQKKKRTR